MERWNGKVAIVTGASSGIGKAITIKLVEHGVIVAGLARRKERVQDLALSLKHKKGALHAYKADMTKEEDIVGVFEYVAKHLGPIHILVNNAGVNRIAPLSIGKTEEWREILETNVLGLSIATREAIQNMRTNNVDGHIIHINSIAGRSGHSGGTNMYGASKYAVTSLTESLRCELNKAKSKTKITSISPGYVETDMIDAVSETSHGLFTKEQLEKFKQSSPKLHAEDVANCALYVLGTPPHVQVHEIIIKPTGERI